MKRCACLLHQQTNASKGYIPLCAKIQQKVPVAQLRCVAMASALFVTLHRRGLQKNTDVGECAYGAASILLESNDQNF